MIETHVFNALLVPELKETVFYKAVTFMNGLVAPSFLFCAGFAFAIAARRKWNAYISLEKPYWRYFVRLLFILVVGYSLHLPKFSLHQLMEVSDPKAWLSFYQTDILQAIAVSLMLLAVLVVILRTEKVFYAVTLLLTLVFVFAAPVVRELNYENFPVWLAPYLTLHVPSQFPLFPWAAFLMSGMLIGAWYIRSNEKGESNALVRRLAWYSFAAIAVSLLLELAPLSVYPNHDFWRASPEFFFVRLGIVVLLLCGLWWREHRKQTSANSVLSLFGQESLLVYVVHLLIVYGHTYEFSFVRVYGPTLNYLQCFGVFAGLTIVMYAMAFVWHRTKAWNGKVAGYLEYAILGGIVLTFLLK